MSCCDMMARARVAAVRAGNSAACSSSKMGRSAPSAMSATRNSGTADRLPSTAAAAPCTSTAGAESNWIRARCHPASMKALASVASTPRLATHCTALACTPDSACNSNSAIRRWAPASRSASRFGSEWESEVSARAAWGSTPLVPACATMATRGWMVMRSMSQYRGSAAKAATTRTMLMRAAEAAGASAPGASFAREFAAESDRMMCDNVPNR
mmetsp:Transcript_2831/g.9576  ORF Transcript_2831/g.9576 Transcript_2831/m.9576 type:complete len:213 (-) Transcript_2831:3106-3744(-)